MVIVLDHRGASKDEDSREGGRQGGGATGPEATQRLEALASRQAATAPHNAQWPLSSPTLQPVIHAPRITPRHGPQQALSVWCSYTYRMVRCTSFRSQEADEREVQLRLLHRQLSATLPPSPQRLAAAAAAAAAAVAPGGPLPMDRRPPPEGEGLRGLRPRPRAPHCRGLNGMQRGSMPRAERGVAG